MRPFPLDTYLKQITGFYEFLAGLEDIADTLTSADTWTIRNHVAHLIDSASNNHQRFVRLQLSSSIVFPGYEAEPWVSVSGIKQMDFGQLILLWKLYNEYLLEVIRTIPDDCLLHTWQPETGGTPRTLDFLVQDYYAHMRIHEKMIGKIAEACFR
ncbi:MAG: hypothetical protein WCR31_00820 [Treponema sp.]